MKTWALVFQLIPIFVLTELLSSWALSHLTIKVKIDFSSWIPVKCPTLNIADITSFALMKIWIHFEMIFRRRYSDRKWVFLFQGDSIAYEFMYERFSMPLMCQVSRDFDFFLQMKKNVNNCHV